MEVRCGAESDRSRKDPFLGFRELAIGAGRGILTPGVDFKYWRMEFSRGQPVLLESISWQLDKLNLVAFEAFSGGDLVLV